MAHVLQRAGPVTSSLSRSRDVFRCLAGQHLCARAVCGLYLTAMPDPEPVAGSSTPA